MADREKLINIIRNARAVHSVCNSDGDPISEYKTPVIDEELVETFADYLLIMGVSINDNKYVRNGKWLKKNVGNDGYTTYADWYCSSCGFCVDERNGNIIEKYHHFCQNCGAKMDNYNTNQ